MLEKGLKYNIHGKSTNVEVLRSVGEKRMLIEGCGERGRPPDANIWIGLKKEDMW